MATKIPIRSSTRQTLVFDGDDTLWENNVYFERAIDDFIAFLDHSTLSPAEVRAVLDEIERANTRVHGYGSAAFGRSLRECYAHLHQRHLDETELATVMGFAERILSQPMEVIAGVEETLADLVSRHDLTLLTKGHDEEQRLDAATFSAATGHLLPTDVLVYLPKFEFAFGAGLVPTLQSLGMTDAFDPRRADFTGMTEPGAPPETDPLFIGDVLHKAFISVDENGTEAAAATIVEMAAGAAPPEEEPLEVRIDRPFLFAIRDTQTGTLLFLGRVVDPSA